MLAEGPGEVSRFYKNHPHPIMGEELELKRAME
jgi:hypothetical protein